MMTIRGRMSRRSGGALVHFSHPPIPDVIHFRERDWRAKREFHVTLLGTTTMRTLTRAGDGDTEDVIRRAGRRLVFTIALRDEFWFMREKDARTIVRMCDVSGADEFLERIEKELSCSIERPPFHVTLYTIGTLRGIGIATRAEMEELGEEIQGSDREALLSVLQ